MVLRSTLPLNFGRMVKNRGLIKKSVQLDIIKIIEFLWFFCFVRKIPIRHETLESGNLEQK